MKKAYRFLFVNYSGYPDYMEYLFAENGLAYLCALLNNAGHKAIIMDYMTLSLAEKLYPKEYMKRVIELREQSLTSIIEKNAIPEIIMSEIKDLEGLIDERNRSVVREVCKEILHIIKDKAIDCVGFKLWSQPSLKDTFYIAQEIKKASPYILLIGGGGHVDYFMDNIFKDNDIFDFLVYGDGEIAVELIPDYLDGKIAIEEIPNIIYKREDKIFVNSKQSVNPLRYKVTLDFSLETYPAINQPDEKVKLIPIENSRGCNYQCGFCIHPIKSGKYREKSPIEFVNEIYSLKDLYGFINFYGVGSNSRHRHCIDILKEVINKGNNIILSFFQSTRDFDLSNEDILRNANIGFLWIGVETGSQELSHISIGSKKKLSKIMDVCMLLKKCGIRTYNSYIYPLPGDNESTERETLEIMLSIDSEWTVIYPPLLQPRTRWFKMPNQYIHFIDRNGFLFSSMYGIEEIENKVLPRIISDQVLGKSLFINKKAYREIYYEYVRFRNKYNENTRCAHHHKYTQPWANENKVREKLYALTDKMTEAIEHALIDGNFEHAKEELTKYNSFCSSGS